MVGGERTMSMEVVRVVADATGRDETTMPPLYDYIDPDALDAVTNRMSEGKIEFRYADCAITVTSDGTVRVETPRHVSYSPGVHVATDRG